MVSPHRPKLKKRAQSSTTLQFAPPNWLTGIFERNSNNIQLRDLPDGDWKKSIPYSIITSISTVPYLSPKLLFIFLCAGLGSSLPYLPIFYDTLKLSPSEIGVVFSVAPLVSALSCPLWTGLADRFQAHRSIIVSIYVLATIGVVSQMFLSRLTVSDTDDKLHGLIVACVFLVALWFAFFGMPVNALVDSGVLKILGDKKELYGQQRYWGSIAYGLSTLGVGLLLEKFDNVNVIFYYFFSTAVLFLIVVITTDFSSAPDEIEIIPIHFRNKSYKPLIDLDDDNDIASSSAGVNNKFNHDNSSDTYLSSNIEESDGDDSSADEDDDDGTQVPDLDIMAFPPTAPTIPTTSLSDSPISAIKILFTTPTVVTLLSVMLLMGIALSMSNSFLFLFLKNDLKASSTILGLTGPVSALTELLCFFYSKELISQFGISSLILLAHVVTIIRCATYMFLQPNVFSHMVALTVQLLNGIGFSSLWVSGVTHIANNTPPNLVSFSQGVMSALYAGIGTGFGSLLGGLLFGSSGGPKLMFGVVITISILSIILYWWGENGFNHINIVSKRRRNHRTRSPWHINYGQTTIERPILSVETVPRTKKGKYELIPIDDDDGEQYHYGVFGENRM